MASRYWVNDDSDGLWNKANNWSTTASGAGGAGVPTSADDVYFTSSCTDNCYMNVDAVMNDLNVAIGYTGTINPSGYDITFYGDVTFTRNTTWVKSTGIISFVGSAWADIIFYGQAVEDVEIEKTGTYTTINNFSSFSTDALHVISKVFVLNDYDITIDGDFILESSAIIYNIGAG